MATDLGLPAADPPTAPGRKLRPAWYGSLAAIHRGSHCRWCPPRHNSRPRAMRWLCTGSHWLAIGARNPDHAHLRCGFCMVPGGDGAYFCCQTGDTDHRQRQFTGQRINALNRPICCGFGQHQRRASRHGLVHEYQSMLVISRAGKKQVARPGVAAVQAQPGHRTPAAGHSLSSRLAITRRQAIRRAVAAWAPSLITPGTGSRCPLANHRGPGQQPQCIVHHCREYRGRHQAAVIIFTPGLVEHNHAHQARIKAGAIPANIARYLRCV